MAIVEFAFSLEGKACKLPSLSHTIWFVKTLSSPHTPHSQFSIWQFQCRRRNLESSQQQQQQNTLESRVESVSGRISWMEIVNNDRRDSRAGSLASSANLLWQTINNPSAALKTLCLRGEVCVCACKNLFLAHKSSSRLEWLGAVWASLALRWKSFSWQTNRAREHLSIDNSAEEVKFEEDKMQCVNGIFPSLVNKVDPISHFQSDDKLHVYAWAKSHGFEVFVQSSSCGIPKPNLLCRGPAKIKELSLKHSIFVERQQSNFMRLKWESEFGLTKENLPTHTLRTRR